jgi:hypothetical protein
MSRLNELETAVLDMMLAGDDASLTLLRKQLERVKVASRQFTGVGFYTILDVQDRVKSGRKLILGDVIADVRGSVRVAFELSLQDGFLHMLEGFTFGNERWPCLPSKLEDFDLKYNNHPRNLATLKAYFDEIGVPES